MRLYRIAQRAVRYVKSNSRTQEENPEEYLSIHSDSGSAILSGRELNLDVPAEAVATDVGAWLDYFSGYELFKSQHEKLARDYFMFWSWFYAGPFLCDLRNAALARGEDVWDYPIFGLLYGKSNCGKSELVKTLLLSMFGKEGFPPNDWFTKGQLATLMEQNRRYPLVFDDMDKTRFGQHGIALIKVLRDKRQAIFYGPPGTGKTYVARKIMEYLASDSGRREVVQFHPSYSYEDFVQGYRPKPGKDGSLTYELKSGPLMRLASEAAESPGEHVLLIDEINRGNLPKILGELLYLLEYRDDEVALMYAEDGTRFFLPENFLIVGTMNTADRSIALIDAALRRRFHFVPFFPDEPPLDGLLRRWLTRHRPEMVGVADIVERLNEQLRGLFGPHLQVGPSYFMKNNLDEGVLQWVWDYDVMPLLEDQLYGQEEELERFKLHRLKEPTLGEPEHENDRIEGASTDPGQPDGV